ncbi:MAG: alkene reductase, partial [Burkholderiales bacterium]|nr:alkene reductase [Burkholderiales bacterium]
MNNDILFEKFKLNNKLTLQNRLLMAPMTRRYADDKNNPTELMIDYYARRAKAGLIITEGTLISKDAIGYGNIPGIFNSTQICKWKMITNKVHQNNGKIFMQIWHCGRVSHPYFHDGNLPISPSAIDLDLKLGSTNLICGKSREATVYQIKELVETYGNAAYNAILAGFDGVEIHGANGYLIDQFLHYCSNRRIDDYGGTPKNMSRFCLEVVEECGNRIGFDRIGLRLSPGGHLNNIITFKEDSQVFKYLLNKLNEYGIAYVHTGAFNDSIIYQELDNCNMTG